MPAASGMENRLAIRSAMPRSRLARRLAHGGSFLANFMTGPSSRQIDMMIFRLERHLSAVNRSANVALLCFLQHYHPGAQGFLLDCCC
jgi:hypothetical protein